MNIINKAGKAIDLLKTKYLMLFKQKVYHGKKYKIKYLLECNKNSNDILILFTACTREGQKARYNYIRTVEEFNCNKLFILDDFGFDQRGAYYLGKDKDFAILKDVESLIEEVCTKVNSKKEIYIGSSKGGYAALFFGVKRYNVTIIAGAPQYRLGDYLTLPNHKQIINYIMGDESKSSVEVLNVLMENRLKENDNRDNFIYLHYSTEEETYKSDLEPLINTLDSLNIKKSYDKHNYESHSELTKYFPQYIKRFLREEHNLK